ncbi:methyltransferase family protein [Croceibacterium salegens]
MVRLDVPDLVVDGAKPLDELAAATGARHDLLYCVLRATEAVGVLRERPDGTWEQTELSEVLRSDVPATLATWRSSRATTGTCVRTRRCTARSVPARTRSI